MHSHHGVVTGIRVIDWLAGDGLYVRTIDCMGQDWPWILAYAVVKVMIILGYLEFARINLREYRRIKEHSAHANAYMSLVRVFVFCAACGYALPLLRMVWPCHRLELFFNLVLAHYTWKLVSDAKTKDFIRKLFGGDADGH